MCLLHICLLAALFAASYGMEGQHTGLVGIPSAAKRGKGFAVPLHRRKGALTRGRMLLRNSSYPLHGTVKDLGYFYATIYIGTPARQFAVIVDTGSTITYVPCASCGSNCGKHKDEAFDPATSSTFRSISCGDSTCLCGNPSCQCVSDKCFYARHYAEQSSSEGFLIEDMFHFQDGSAPVPIRFGCETKETGEIFRQEADGIMGLGNSDASIINQLVGANQIDDAFSMCFGSVEGDGILLMGDVDLPADIPLQYTDMVPTRAHYYLVKLEGIALAGQPVNVRQGLYDIGYGVVLDSGTTFSYLPSEAYSAFLELLEKHVKAKGLKRTTGPDPRFANTDICWGGAPTIEQAHRLGDKFPVLQLNFGGGVSLTLHPLNYLFMHTRESGAYCLGIFDNGHQGTLLGGITFRNVLIKYDRRNQRVGFGYAACQRLGMDLAPPCDVMSSLQGDTTGMPLTDCRTLPSLGALSPGAAHASGTGTYPQPAQPPPSRPPGEQQAPQPDGSRPGDSSADAGGSPGSPGGGGEIESPDMGESSADMGDSGGSAALVRGAGGATGAPGGPAAARPGAEDGAFRSEEEIDGQEGISFSSTALWLQNLSPLQIALLATSIVVTVGAIALATLQLALFVRQHAARRGPSGGPRGPRYTELTNMSPAGSDDETDHHVADLSATDIESAITAKIGGGAVLTQAPGVPMDRYWSRPTGNVAENAGSSTVDSTNPFLQPGSIHGSGDIPGESMSSGAVATHSSGVGLYSSAEAHSSGVAGDESNPFVDIPDTPRDSTAAETNPFVVPQYDLLGLDTPEGGPQGPLQGPLQGP